MVNNAHAEAQRRREDKTVFAFTPSAPLRLCVRFGAAGTIALAAPWLTGGALAEERAPAIQRLDDATRVKVLAALAALVILGFAMVLLTWLAARVVQRYRRGTSYFSPTPRPGEHAWARKPLLPPERDDDRPAPGS